MKSNYKIFIQSIHALIKLLVIKYTYKQLKYYPAHKHYA